MNAPEDSSVNSSNPLKGDCNAGLEEDWYRCKPHSRCSGVDRPGPRRRMPIRVRRAVTSSASDRTRFKTVRTFVLDGSPGQAGGFNTTGVLNRADNIFATGDANGRAVYDGTCGAADGTGTGPVLQRDHEPGPEQPRRQRNPACRHSAGPFVPTVPGRVWAALVAGLRYRVRRLAHRLDPVRSHVPPAQLDRRGHLPDDNCLVAVGLHVYQAATDTPRYRAGDDRFRRSLPDCRHRNSPIFTRATSPSGTSFGKHRR